jgi:hypothetical protein
VFERTCVCLCATYRNPQEYPLWMSTSLYYSDCSQECRPFNTSQTDRRWTGVSDVRLSLDSRPAFWDTCQKYSHVPTHKSRKGPLLSPQARPDTCTYRCTAIPCIPAASQRAHYFPTWCTTFDQGPRGSAPYREQGAIWDAPSTMNTALSQDPGQV